MDLFEKSLNVLELPAVLEMLASEAVCAEAKSRARALKPSTNRFEVADRLSETTDAKKLLVVKGTPAISDVRDVGESLGRAKMGGMLNMRELLDIAVVLRCARSVAAYADASDAGSLTGLFRSLHPNKYLEERITDSIVSEEEMADSASSELAMIRRKIRAANARVREILQRMITSASYQKALQEPIITQRGDRYVIPVKAEHRGSVAGLVHDVSSSGATLFIEPMSVVEANNEIRELEVKEKREIERILMELSDEAANFEDDIRTDYDIIARLDLIFAKAKLSSLLNCSEPELSEGWKTVLRRARHPLLPKGSAVPIDIAVGGDFDTLVITGPNTGGKTVSIKTLGLLCAMAQCGLHVTADYGSCVPVYGKILADIGDEQSIEQSLSTFSSHMTNIVSILKEAGEDSLLLFDELGAGTDPAEGAALAISVIEHARRLGAKLAVTTHYAELKIYATTEPGVMNASCEFDVETLRPTYRLIMGIPGKSNAFEISRRLGLDESIIEDASKRIETGDAELEKVLEVLQKERQTMEKRSEETRVLLEQARRDSERAAELRKSVEAEKEKAALIARREAERIIDGARRAADETFDELKELRKLSMTNENVQRMNEARAKLAGKLNDASDSFGEEQPEEEPAAPPRDIEAGDTVEIRRLGTRAEVISVSPDGTLNLQAGIMKITAKPEEVKLLEGVASETKKYIERSTAKLSSMSCPPDIDLRGLQADEAVLMAERYIDSAVMAKLNTVTIIHGKGTGALRAAVQTMLRKNPSVRSFRLGKYGEGETGVTVVELKH